MNLSKNKLMFIIIGLLILSTSTVLARPKFQLETKSTWDLDIINSEDTGYTGDGVYVAVLDTGLTPNWRDYFPSTKIATNLGKGFKEIVKWDSKTNDFIETGIIVEETYIGSTGTTHGTHVTSTIIGYNYYSPNDAAGGYPLIPIFINGVAPDVTIIPVKVLSDYNFGKNHDPHSSTSLVFGTDLAVAKGIEYATELAVAGYYPMIITMSLGGPTDSQVINDAIDYAIDNGVIVVAAAGNDGEVGMDYPGAYAPVISVGSCGWTKEWRDITNSSYYRLWWLQDNTYGFNDITEPTPVEEVYISDFSGRELSGQELDVVAPGSWVRGPYPGYPGYSHLPWWSNGMGSSVGRNPGNFYYVGGTSMATPHVAGIIAQMLEKNPSLEQSDVETILKTTALPIPPGSATVFDLSPVQDWYTYSWDSDATGAGLVQADDAVAAVP